MDENTQPVWHRQPDETDTAWLAFQTYRDMPPVGDRATRRNFTNLSKILGHKTDRTIATWSTKYNWMERIRAFDTHMGNRAITVREATIEQYQQNVILRRSAQINEMDEIFERMLAELKDRQMSGQHVRTTDYKNLAEAMRILDDVSRRLANMPTTFNSSKVDEPTDEDNERVYFIGGD